MARPISDADLHAYVDQQLDPARRAEVDAWLAGHPEDQLRVDALRAQVQALHAAYDPVLNEALPARLAVPPRRPAWSMQLAAGLLVAFLGGMAGWFGHARMQPAPGLAASFAGEALRAHVLFAAEQRHPVEVPAAEEAHLVAWLSRRLQAPVRAPDLQAQGFALLGGRLLPGREAPLAQLMYESKAGERLTLTVRHLDKPDEQTGFAVMEKDGASAFYWIDRDYGYALSGSVGRARMLQLARAVEAGLARPAAAGSAPGAMPGAAPATAPAPTTRYR